MKVVLQVVKHASVSIAGKRIAKIERGFLLFVGFEQTDSVDTMHKMIDKIISLRVFPDHEGKTNCSLQEVEGSVLCVSQFTLAANIKKGRRPSFVEAMHPSFSEPLYQQTLAYLQTFCPCQAGVFGADMEVDLCNEGPFTLMLRSEDL